MFWADEDVEFIEATYEPGGASSPDDALGRHSGHEFGHVLSGTLRVVVGFDEFILGPGDSITFPSSTPHRLSNEGGETVRAVWVVRGRRGAHPGTRRSRRRGGRSSSIDNAPSTVQHTNTSSVGKDAGHQARSRFEQQRAVEGGPR